MRDGGFAILHHGHFLALDGMPTDGRVHLSTTSKRAHTDGLVLASHAARLQLLNQRGVRLETARHHHNARCILIQTVDDPCPGMRSSSGA